MEHVKWIVYNSTLLWISKAEYSLFNLGYVAQWLQIKLQVKVDFQTSCPYCS